MIRYALKCGAGHDFESWFQGADAFERLKAAGQVTCALCGSAEVEKALMAPGVAKGSGRPAPSTAPVEAEIAALKARIEAESDYVGPRFAAEARAIHEGRAEARAIHGEASREEARQLIEEGLPVAPLPFVPTSKAH